MFAQTGGTFRRHFATPDFKYHASNAKKANEWNDQRTQDFESEFVEILNQQCFRFLYQKLEKARESPEGPLSTRNISLASSKEVLKYISELGISKVALRVEDIEAILVCISQRL